MGQEEPEEMSISRETLDAALREFLAYLREGTMPQCECHDNIKSLAMVFAAVESSRRGERVEIEDIQGNRR